MPTILLAQEDAESREHFSALLYDFFPTANLQTVEAWSGLESTLAATPNPTVLLADLLWGGADLSGELLVLAEKYPFTFVSVFGRYDLGGSLPPGYPLPLLAPDDSLPLRLAEFMENLSGRGLGPYRILEPAGPHPLGRLYWAKHHQLQRSVQILVPPAGSPVFPKAIRAMARVNHPSVYSLYESVPWESRILVALEPVPHPSLLHFRLSGQTPGLVDCARLSTVLGSVLAEMESSSVPARLLGEWDYTLSPKGTPRLRNPAAYPGQPEASAYENARHLAGLLEPFLREQPRGESLLGILKNPGPSAFDLLKKARALEQQLAEVREVNVRQEEVEAAQKTLRARVVRRWAISLGAVALAAFAAVSVLVIRQNFFLDLPGRLQNPSLLVASGRVRLDGQTVEVPSFFLDRHEVTIGEYEKFLQELPNLNLDQLLPQDRREDHRAPQDFEPRDWATILRQAKIRGRYPNDFQRHRTIITRDTPVFNVDYLSAYAYARWKGRRLPKKEEWILAASGEPARPYPWGADGKKPGINLGCQADPRRLSDPGYFHVLPAESSPEDVGPFGHLDLGGNLSEWIHSPEVHRSPGSPAAFIGGNYLDQAPVLNANAVRFTTSEQGDPRIGFRTAQ